MREVRDRVYWVLKIVPFFLCLFVSIGYAGGLNKPTKVRLHDNDQATVILSSTDINRLFVKSEKITSINSPSGLVAAQNDESGSLYLKVYSQSPFTTFITTDAGRHFSLFIIPKKVPGQTFYLLPLDKLVLQVNQEVLNNLKKLRKNHKESASSYESSLVAMIKEGILGQTPAGFTAINEGALYSVAESKVEKQLSSNHAITQQVVKVWLGGDLSVRVIQIKNGSKHPVELSASEFYTPDVRAVALEQESLLPGMTTHVTEVVSHE